MKITGTNIKNPDSVILDRNDLSECFKVLGKHPEYLEELLKYLLFHAVYSDSTALRLYKLIEGENVSHAHPIKKE